jgi:uncharacterized protein YdbL (DUF1318 family)
MKRALAVLPAAIVLFAACVTINVYFPEAAIKDLSQQIEEEVQKQAAEEATSGEPQEETAAPEGDRRSGLLDLLLGATPASAQEVAAPEVTNPAIRKIIDSRAKRVPELAKYRSQGVIGENNKGLVEILKLDAVGDLRERAEVQRLVKAENADREQLYKEIAAAQNVDLSQLPRIQETYASTLREKSPAGHWIQLPDGKWEQKK